MKRIVAVVAALLIVVVIGAAWLFSPRQSSIPASTTAGDARSEVIRGEYLARVGDCEGCHTVRGGQPYAGGLEIDTPFGQFYATNITPDAQTGIGTWSSDDFWRALHDGKGKDGALLYPTMPYT